jgi:hypothetical protein
MKRSRFSPTLVAALCIAFTATPSWAEYRRIATIQFSNVPLLQFDISWVDESGNKYYLADRSNAAIDIFDARTNAFEGRVGGFTGFNPAQGTPTAGPNGVVVIDSRNELWASDGDSTVKVIDLQSRQIVAVISTGGVKRADEMAYDPRDQIMLVANNADPIPFLTFISTQTRQLIGGKLMLPDTTADGIEQPVWHAASGRFLLAVPETPMNPQGEIKVVDPLTRQVTKVFPINFGGKACSPHGLTLGPRDEMLVGCSRAGANLGTVIMNSSTGATVKIFTEVGASDQVWFNESDRKYYLGARNMVPPRLGVIESEDNSFVQNVQTTPAAHSVAASALNNHVFVPLTPTVPADPQCVNGCIGVYADEGDEGDVQRDQVVQR